MNISDLPATSRAFMRCALGTCALLAALSLTACTAKSAPVIAFIGVSPGTLETALDDLAFTQRFETDQTSIVGVVSFESIPDGSTVQATWFSPDDRRMPLGRTNIVTQSGAKVARFTLSNTERWEPAPYMLQIHAWNGDGEDRSETASGSIQFFVGMDDDDIGEYMEAYQEWETRRAEQQQVAELEQERNGAREDAAKELMQSPVAVLGYMGNLMGDDAPEYVYLDTREQAMFEPSRDPGILLSATVQQLVVTDGSGALLSGILRDRRDHTFVNAAGDRTALASGSNASIHVTLLPTPRLLVTWQEDAASCIREATLNDADTWTIGDKVCDE